MAHSAAGIRTQHVACWGWRLGSVLRANGHEVLVMERGYLGDRFSWTSLAWNGLNNRGTAPVIDDPRRFNKHFALEPVRPGSDYVLIVGQVPGDMALMGRDLHPWYCLKAREALESGHKVVFRPHPLAGRRGPVRDVPGAITDKGELHASLAGAIKVVTFNSNTGVDAVVAGKVATCEDEGSMIYGMGDREQWAHRLAWRQWRMEEISSGFALEKVGVPDGR